jgi:aryl-alcohol dehydrogenase-like predicted oxidoreductase
MGGCPLGGYGWGSVNNDDLIHSVRSAIDNGITLFDTADVYGLGSSEETLGKAIANHRHNVVIATKFGVRIQNGITFYDNSVEWIKKAIDGSLKRLNTDYIDLYQIHYRDNKTPLIEIVEFLMQLKKEGKVRYFGLSNISINEFDELKLFDDKFISFQTEYSLANRENENTMKEIRKQTLLTPMTWGSLGQGILSGKYTENSMFGKDDRRSRDIYKNFHGDKLFHNLMIVDKLRTISESIGYSVPSVAIRFILDYLKDCIVIVGIKNERQLISNIECMSFGLNEDQIKMLLSISDYRHE